MIVDGDAVGLLVKVLDALQLVVEDLVACHR